MNVDQVLNRKANINEVLHFFDTESIHVTTNSVSMISHFIEHVPIGLAEPMIVFEEITVAVDVSHYEFVIRHAIAGEQIGIAWIIIDHHLVDLLESIRIPLGKLVVLHAEPPMRITCGKSPVCCDGIQLISVNDFENGRKEIEPVVAGMPLHLLLDLDQVGGEFAEDVNRSHVRQSLVKVGFSARK